MVIYYYVGIDGQSTYRAVLFTESTQRNERTLSSLLASEPISPSDNQPIVHPPQQRRWLPIFTQNSPQCTRITTVFVCVRYNVGCSRCTALYSKPSVARQST